MLTEDKIIEHANFLLEKRTLTPAEYPGWISGATWANGYNAEELEQLIEDKKYLSLTISNAAEWSKKQSAEIAELVAALKHLNGVCRANFGIGDPQVSELLKKYDP